MSRAPQATGAANATPAPPANGTCPFDLLPNELINVVIAHACPSTTLTLLGDNLLREPQDHDHTLLALRSTCNLFKLLCQPFVQAVYDGHADQVEASARQLLGILRVARPRARRCRKLVLDQTSDQLQHRLLTLSGACATILPNVDEVVLSGSGRASLFNLAFLANFPGLAHLTVADARFMDDSSSLVFPRLSSLTLIRARTKEPWLITKSVMPALSQMSIRDSRFEPAPSSTSRRATDLLEQLDCLEIGEDRTQAADARVLVPFETVPSRLPVLWRLDLDSKRVGDPTLSASCAYFGLGSYHTYLTRGRDPRDARLAKLGIILSTLPELKLVLVPTEFWFPPLAPAPSDQAKATQQALAEELVRRGVELWTFVPGALDGVVPEFTTFLREREHGTATGGGLQRAA